MLLIYDMNGGRQEAAEFNIHALTAGRSFDAIAHDAENLYLVSNSPGLGSIADVLPYSKLGTAGRRFALEGIPDNSPFEDGSRGDIPKRRDCCLAAADGGGGAAVDCAVQDEWCVCRSLVQRVGHPLGYRSQRHDTGGELGVPA